MQISELNTTVNLNVLPLGSYNLLIGMDWLEAHRAIVDCFNKSFVCIDDDQNVRIVQGIPKEVKAREISAMKLKNNSSKGC